MLGDVYEIPIYIFFLYKEILVTGLCGIELLLVMCKNTDD
jgi:hypothetical protein